MQLWGKSDEKIVTFFPRKFALISWQSLKFWWVVCDFNFNLYINQNQLNLCFSQNEAEKYILSIQLNLSIGKTCGSAKESIGYNQMSAVTAFHTQGPGNQPIYLSRQKILVTIFDMKTQAEKIAKFSRVKRQTDHGQTELNNIRTKEY